MHSGPSGLTIVYNGELYNYRALRRELEAEGVKFLTAGDTEVVLRMIERWWDKALPRFDGMFGLAVWDSRNERILLARDQIGEKPLYYAITDAQIVFASEIKGIFAEGSVTPRINPDGLRQLLRFRAVYGNHTVYGGINQLLPGMCLEFSSKGTQLRRYYNLVDEVNKTRKAISGLSKQNVVELGCELFRKSIKERLCADVPLGAFLSGGLDSSLIVAIANTHLTDTQFKTFSVGFDDDIHTELPYAARVSEFVGTEHEQVRVGPNDFMRRLEELSICRDGPVSEPADVAIACMSRLARQSVKVVLTGEGADEVFAGYPKYVFANVPSCFRTIMRHIGPVRIARLASLVQLDPRRALVAARAMTPKTEVSRLVQWFSYMQRDDLVNWFPGLDWSDAVWADTQGTQTEVLEEMASFSPLARMQALDCLTWLPNNLLERGDRMTMAEGLEARPPFLDTDLVHYGLALGDSFKVRGWHGKWVVREWAKNYLPEDIIWRKKWGFRVPLGRWFGGPLRAYLHDMLLSTGGLTELFGDRKRISHLLSEHDRGLVNHDLTLWSLLAAECWYRSANSAYSIH
jgi:asparagine synthase (glutamine-hydrolysing)